MLEISKTPVQANQFLQKANYTPHVIWGSKKRDNPQEIYIFWNGGACEKKTCGVFI